MVGISLALLLAEQSLDCSISLIEQHPFPQAPDSPQWQPSFDDRSTALSAGSIDILEAIGCWRELRHGASPIHAVHVSDRGHFGGLRLNAGDYQRDALGYVVANRWLGQVLTQQLQQAPVHCLTPARVTACKAVVGGYQLMVDCADMATNPTDETATSVSLHADLLLIADGADSRLRQALGIATEVHDYHQWALIANVALSRPHQGIAYERFTDEGPIALLPLDDLAGVHRAALVWTLPEAVLESLRRMPETAIINRLQQRFGYRAGTIEAIGKCHCYYLQRVQALEQVRSHCVLIGNAAHFLHPVAGQGFNLALRDCQALVECLVNARQQNLDQAVQPPLGDLATLNQYLARQQRDQQLTIGLTDQLVKVFSNTTLPLAVLRQLGLISMNLAPPVKHRFAEKMMGLN